MMVKITIRDKGRARNRRMQRKIVYDQNEDKKNAVKLKMWFNGEEK